MAFSRCRFLARVAPQYGAATETRAAPGLVSRHGKLEKSLLSFKAVNPAWSPRGAAKEYLERLEASAVEYAAATARSGFPSESLARSQRSDKGAVVADSATSSAARSLTEPTQAGATIASLPSIHEDETAGALAMNIFGRVGGACRLSGVRTLRPTLTSCANPRECAPPTDL